MNALKKFEPTAYAALRIVFGFLFACHGASKVFTALGGQKPHGVLGWTGAGIELVGGVLILIGLLTHLAGFPGERRNGCRVFHGAPAKKFFAAEKRRRACSNLLLRRAVYRLSRDRQMGRGQRLSAYLGADLQRCAITFQAARQLR
jgi:hypothetical protein